MGKQDSLMRAAQNARLQGSGKTVKAHKEEAMRFASELREAGYGVKRWDNLTSKHLAVVAERWVDQELKASTIHEYISGVRKVAEAYGNTHLKTTSELMNEAGQRIVEARVYATNQDKAVPLEVYAKSLERLRSGEFGEDGKRLACQMDLMRELGLRYEEARKFNPERSVLADGRVYIVDGTKGGRDRMLHEVSEKGWAAIEGIRPYIDKQYGNSMPCKEATWEGRGYDMAQATGISRAECGASFHGLRHAYAQERYEQMTGFRCQAAGGTLEEAVAAAGDRWQDRDEEARLLLKGELGHGPERDSVVSTYIGTSW